ncbi:MAG: hypothetical protein ACREMN_08710 [Gemmatimonadales bacterium]
MRAILAVLLTVGLAGTGSAQRLHQGFWIGFAPGGVGVADGEGLVYPLYLRLGGTIDQRLLLGVEWFGVVLDDHPATIAENYSLTALFYPSTRGGFFAKAGLGLGRAASRCPDQPVDVISGVGMTVGAGYDVRIGRNVYLTPTVDGFWQPAERILCPPPGQPDAGTVRSYSPAFLFTVGLMWH